ncbi:VTC domain-containing protein [Pseudoalteromonas sp. MSK9-3]|uniref:polyphosphate polymerase domain-containing protein n=1 Tax=Pseudoalteromonas sp. MSK9-3 TaxID=1897633 RepID=UPI000E6D3D9F|nr:polyphosphate polymerase domain-containing protein [Pseudoalteromonas sp. MSK9-3]RJE73546.1 VTC domain-containing protein [Pseudoalteromonas sp. MSK9-3]
MTQPSRRFEVKIPIPLNRLHTVQAWLNTHSLGFEKRYPDRFVNSLYLDDAHLERYEENLSGISFRKKVRIRWYDDLADVNNAKLEFKHREAGKGFKVTFGLDFDFSKNRTQWPSILRDAYRSLPHRGQILWGNEQMPVLICRYQRQYFESTCRRIRATFDQDMHVYDQRYHAKLNLHKQVSLGAYVLLELKTDEQYEPDLAALIATCPLRPSRHSKYVNGIRMLTWY